MSIETYNCYVCEQDFCQECTPPDFCMSCGNTIDSECQAEEMKSDRGDFILCKTCWDKGTEKERNQWLLKKNRLTKLENSNVKEVKLKPKTDIFQQLRQLK